MLSEVNGQTLGGHHHHLMVNLSLQRASLKKILEQMLKGTINIWW